MELFGPHSPKMVYSYGLGQLGNPNPNSTIDLHIFPNAAESLDGAGSTDPGGMMQKEKEKQYNASTR